MGFLSGFGMDRFDTSYNQLMHVTVPFVENADCKKSYPKLTPRHLCAGYKKGGKNSCQGDSGINLRPSKLLPAFERNIVQHTFDFLHLFQTV